MSLESQGIGARLRDERLAQGLTIDAIVARTRIQARFLEAIEADDLGQFPGIVFARNFVRQYAVALGLDPEPLLDALPKLDQASVPLPAPPSRPRARRTRLSNPVWSSFGWALAAVAAAALAWMYHNGDWRMRAREAFPGIARAQAPVEAAKAPVPAAPQAAAPPAPPSPSQQTAAESVPPPAGPVSSSPVQVVVTAHEPSWISVTADSKSAFVGTLKPNETREISALDRVKIVTGNAGGLTISLNGKTLDPLGPSGQVRSIMLTAEGFELLSKVPDSPASAPADPL